MFEEIDTTGDGQVSFNELSEFMATPKALQELQDLTDEELENVESFINDGDTNESEGKMTFDEFLQVMKENRTMSRLVLKIAASNHK